MTLREKYIIHRTVAKVPSKAEQFMEMKDSLSIQLALYSQNDYVSLISNPTFTGIIRCLVPPNILNEACFAHPF